MVLHGVESLALLRVASVFRLASGLKVGAGGEAAARKRQKEGRILAKPTHQDSLLLCLRII